MDEAVIPIFRVDDADTAVQWYERLGFAKQWEHRFEPGMPAFVLVARGDIRLYLSEHLGDATPGTLVSLHVRDVDAVASEFGVPVRDLPWGGKSGSTISMATAFGLAPPRDELPCAA